MQIRRDDLSGPEIRALLEEHLRDMHALSPPESVHALDLGALRQPDITFWTAWDGADLLACGALRELDPTHGEIKSMRTVKTRRRHGAARAMLEHILAEARQRGYRRLSLETGAMAAFDPARHLYETFGFRYCAPFGDYADDPHSTFMSKALVPGVEFRVRPAIIADAAEIARLSGELGYAATPQQMAERLGVLLPQATQFVAVAASVDGLWGWIAAERRTPLEIGDRAEIVGLVADARARRAGVGQALVRAAERWTLAHGLDSLTVRSNVQRAESHTFYEQLGFVRFKTQHSYAKALRRPIS